VLSQSSRLLVTLVPSPASLQVSSVISVMLATTAQILLLAVSPTSGIEKLASTVAKSAALARSISSSSLSAVFSLPSAVTT